MTKLNVETILHIKRANTDEAVRNAALLGDDYDVVVVQSEIGDYVRSHEIGTRAGFDLKPDANGNIDDVPIIEEGTGYILETIKDGDAPVEQTLFQRRTGRAETMSDPFTRKSAMKPKRFVLDDGKPLRVEGEAVSLNQTSDHASSNSPLRYPRTITVEDGKLVQRMPTGADVTETTIIGSDELTYRRGLPFKRQATYKAHLPSGLIAVGQDFDIYDPVSGAVAGRDFGITTLRNNAVTFADFGTGYKLPKYHFGMTTTGQITSAGQFEGTGEVADGFVGKGMTSTMNTKHRALSLKSTQVDVGTRLGLIEVSANADMNSTVARFNLRLMGVPPMIISNITHLADLAMYLGERYPDEVVARATSYLRKELPIGRNGAVSRTAIRLIEEYWGTASPRTLDRATFGHGFWLSRTNVDAPGRNIQEVIYTDEFDSTGNGELMPTTTEAAIVTDDGFIFGEEDDIHVGVRFTRDGLALCSQNAIHDPSTGRLHIHNLHVSSQGYAMEHVMVDDETAEFTVSRARAGGPVVEDDEQPFASQTLVDFYQNTLEDGTVDDL